MSCLESTSGETTADTAEEDAAVTYYADVDGDGFGDHESMYEADTGGGEEGEGDTDNTDEPPEGYVTFVDVDGQKNLPSLLPAFCCINANI